MEAEAAAVGAFDRTAVAQVHTLSNDNGWVLGPIAYAHARAGTVGTWGSAAEGTADWGPAGTGRGWCYVGEPPDEDIDELLEVIGLSCETSVQDAAGSTYQFLYDGELVVTPGGDYLWAGTLSDGAGPIGSGAFPLEAAGLEAAQPNLLPETHWLAFSPGMAQDHATNGFPLSGAPTGSTRLADVVADLAWDGSGSDCSTELLNPAVAL